MKSIKFFLRQPLDATCAVRSQAAAQLLLASQPHLQPVDRQLPAPALAPSLFEVGADDVVPASLTVAGDDRLGEGCRTALRQPPRG